MSTPELPADVSAQIHSHYTSPNSTLQGALKQFSNAVGYPFDICISWPSLYAVYAPEFPHKTTFIPALSSFIVEMLQSLINYLEEKDDPGGFQDQWLRICEEHPSVYQAGLLVRARGVERPKCYFTRPRTNSVYRWVLDLPRRWGEEEFKCRGGRVIWRLKDEPDPEIDSGRGLMIPEDSTSASTFDIGETPMDTWSLLSGDVGGGLMPANMESDLPLQTPISPYSKLPALSTLPPPAQLFSTSLASYNHLLIMHANSASIDIQCTHQPTLELIRDYFTKHSRLNQNKTTLPPFVKIELLKSMWGSSRTTSEDPVPEEPKDASAIALAEPMEMLRFQCREELNYGARLDHAYIVGFVEGVCGYRLVEGCTGESGRWVFRRMFIV